MLKFNFANLNSRFRSASDDSSKSTQNTCSICDDVQNDPPPVVIGVTKPRYSAYRTVVARHEQLAARINAKEHQQDACQNPPEQPEAQAEPNQQ